MLAKAGRRAVGRGTLAVENDRSRHEAESAEVLDHVAVGRLRVGEGLADAVDGTSGDSGGFECGGPMARRLFASAGFDQGDEDGAVSDAGGVSGETLV